MVTTATNDHGAGATYSANQCQVNFGFKHWVK